MILARLQISSTRKQWAPSLIFDDIVLSRLLTTIRRLLQDHSDHARDDQAGAQQGLEVGRVPEEQLVAEHGEEHLGELHVGCFGVLCVGEAFCEEELLRKVSRGV